MLRIRGLSSRAKIVALALVVIGTSANATPVFLQCTVTLQDGHGGTFERHLEVNLNEAEGTAGFVMAESGFSAQQRPAIFSPSQVSWTFPWVTGSKTITISRTDLSVYATEPDVKDDDWHGRCQIPEDDPARKF